ncbi:MAG: RNA-binding protein [Deltaproteobacteria bacterium]|nr:RNA-binding protein [Deltaproteobacteria bacterium]
MKTLFVGNLPFSSTQAEITELFAQFGTVNSVTMIAHRESGRPRGFCFVEMDDQGALDAIKGLNETEFGGRKLKVELRYRDLDPSEPRYQARQGSQD